MDFVIGLPKSKGWQEVEYNFILVIIYRLTKIVYYEPIFIILDTEQLVEILIEIFIKYYGLLDLIVIN